MQPISNDHPNDPPNSELESLLGELLRIRADMVDDPALSQQLLPDVHANYRDSSRNLLHYLALRRRDLRPLQIRLAALGLSSLGRAESHVLASLDSVIGVLHHLLHREWHPVIRELPIVDFSQGERLLADHTDTLLGAEPASRCVRIMVTMPSEAAEDYLLVHDLLEQGMNCMRINCAHDDASKWSRMIEHLKRAKESLGRQCKVVMDLGGPKLRTGPLQPGPAVIRIHPHRDDFGRVIAPARVWLTSATNPQPAPSPADACLPLPANWLAQLSIGESLTFTDARDAHRKFKLVDITESGCWVEAMQTAYIIPGIILQRDESNGKLDDLDEIEAPIGALPASENVILVKQGDLLILTRMDCLGHPATHDHTGQILTPAMIGCSIPKIFADVQAGEAIWFDDGKIGGVVEKVEQAQVLIRITHARSRGDKLQSDKGINLPDSQLRLPAITSKDVADLAFIAEHADIVELSFANSVQDVESLQQQLAQLGSRQPAIVLKIETRRGFENLPNMLLAAMRSPCCGVMIARGDLAVECGFERMAEVQEEILWICEAAHVPVIWATQVLENLAKEGLPSRAEISDAAMGHRAECVMLNKGPHILSAVRVLHDILVRMESHQDKKRAMLRELRLAHARPSGKT